VDEVAVSIRFRDVAVSSSFPSFRTLCHGDPAHPKSLLADSFNRLRRSS
jgi:hypothetical protein